MNRFPFPEAVGLVMIAVLTVLGGCQEPTPQEAAAAAAAKAARAEAAAIAAEEYRAREAYSAKMLDSMRIARICGSGDNTNYIYVSFDGRLWMSSYQHIQSWGWNYINPIAAGVTLQDVC